MLILILFGLFIYSIPCLLVASIGEKREIGFWGVFWVSFLLTPPIGIAVGLLSSKLKLKKQYKCLCCNYISEQDYYYCPRCQKDTSGRTIEENKEFYNYTESSSQIKKGDDRGELLKQLEQIASLKEKEIITQLEYEKEKAIILTKLGHETVSNSSNSVTEPNNPVKENKNTTAFSSKKPYEPYKENNTQTWVMLIILLLLIIGGACYYGFYYKNKNTVEGAYLCEKITEQENLTTTDIITEGASSLLGGNCIYSQIEFKEKAVIVYSMGMSFVMSYERDGDYIKIKTDKTDLLFKIQDKNTLIGEGFAKGIYRKAM